MQMQMGMRMRVFVCVAFPGLGLLYSLGLTECLTSLVGYMCELDTQLSSVARLRELAIQKPESGPQAVGLVPVGDDWPSKVHPEDSRRGEATHTPPLSLRNQHMNATRGCFASTLVPVHRAMLPFVTLGFGTQRTVRLCCGTSGEWH